MHSASSMAVMPPPSVCLCLSSSATADLASPHLAFSCPSVAPLCSFPCAEKISSRRFLQQTLSRPLQRHSVALHARRKTSSFASENSEDIDPDIAVGLNEVSTEALKVMLGGDIQQLRQLKDKVDFLGEYLVQEKQMDAARFMLVIKGMLDHQDYLNRQNGTLCNEQVLPETHDLQGPYKKAFDKIWGLVEDAGWLLSQPGAEGGDVPMVDDELIPPVIQTQY